MNFELKFTPEAEETYDAVKHQLMQKWGEVFVKKFENKLSKCLDNISSNPFLYPVIEENIEIRKCILHKNCSMLYKVYDFHVLIVCFWDNRQNPIIA